MQLVEAEQAAGAQPVARILPEHTLVAARLTIAIRLA